MILVDEATGNRYEVPTAAWVGPDGSVLLANGVRLTRVPKLHTFGGVMFEETGETRVPSDEWVFVDSGNNNPAFFPKGTTPLAFRILRPVPVTR